MMRPFQEIKENNRKRNNTMCCAVSMWTLKDANYVRRILLRFCKTKTKKHQVQRTQLIILYSEFDWPKCKQQIQLSLGKTLSECVGDETVLGAVDSGNVICESSSKQLHQTDICTSVSMIGKYFPGPWSDLIWQKYVAPAHLLSLWSFVFWNQAFYWLLFIDNWWFH